ncbi:hypothetical protein NE237_019782 [Protea cynaroides]|uniref:Uncharacterized protein n=1 Tax=Protea cynaroides TaxID=273540 RepID=A0A9Q0H4T4_9MAGN|nr:hypothetical protein NE237_019782 [Protea cynaroides]
MYGTEPSHCKRRQLFLLMYASTNADPPNTELWVGLKPPPPLSEWLRLGHVTLSVLDQADDSDAVSQMWHILESNRSSTVTDQICDDSVAELLPDASIVMFGALDELFEKTGVRPKDIGVLVRTSLDSQVDLEALRREKLAATKKKTMYIKGFLPNHVRHRTGNRTGSPNSSKIDRKDRQRDLLDSIMAFFQQEKLAFKVNFLCCPLRSVISYRVGEKRLKVYVPLLSATISDLL